MHESLQRWADHKQKQFHQAVVAPPDALWEQKLIDHQSIATSQELGSLIERTTGIDKKKKNHMVAIAA